MASNIPALSTDQIVALSSTTLTALTTEDWAAFSTQQLSVLTAAQAPYISRPAWDDVPEVVDDAVGDEHFAVLVEVEAPGIGGAVILPLST